MSTSDTIMRETATAPATSTSIKMNDDESLAWGNESALTKWVNGAVITHMPPTIVHQQLVGFLLTLLQTFVRLHRLGRVLAAPVAMRAMPNGNAREPDVLFILTEYLDRLTDEELNGPADLVVEVISTESMAGSRRQILRVPGSGRARILDVRPAPRQGAGRLLCAG